MRRITDDPLDKKGENGAIKESIGWGKEREREGIAQRYRFGREKKAIVPMTSISERKNNFALLFFRAYSTIVLSLKMLLRWAFFTR